MNTEQRATESEIREAYKLMRTGARARIAARAAQPDCTPAETVALGIGAADAIRQIAADARKGKMTLRQLFTRALKF